MTTDRNEPILREAFTIRLKDGALEQWRQAHDHVWPDLLAEQKACGFRAMAVYDLGHGELVVTSEVTQADAWANLINLPLHKRWVAHLSHLSESALPDQTVQRGHLTKVLELTFDE